MRTTARMFLYVVLCAIFSSVTCAEPGDLDTTFGIDGRLATNVRSNRQGARAVALQSDGKIVIAGYSFTENGDYVNFGVARFTVSGVLDSAFGVGGVTVTDTNRGLAGANSISVQSDGRIVAAGFSYNEDWTSIDFALERYTLEGVLDTSFGVGGKVTTKSGMSNGGSNRLAMQSDGKFIVAGTAEKESGTDIVLVRYTPSGALDKTFGVDGTVITNFATFDYARSVVVQIDGKIVVAGLSYNPLERQPLVLVRYTANGSVDGSFGTNGKITTFNIMPTCMSLQDDGKIIVAGSTYTDDSDVSVIRFLPDGALDASFGTAGQVTTRIRGTYESARMCL